MKVNVQKLCSLDGHKDCVYALDSGKESNLFYSAGGDGMVAEWDLHHPENGQLVAQMKNAVYAICYLTDKQLLIVGQNFEGIHMIDPAERKEVGSLQISAAPIFDIKSYDNKIFIASGDGILYVVDQENLAIVTKIKLADKSIRSIAINTHLGELAVGLSDNSIRIIDMENYSQKYLINAHKLSVFKVCYNPLNNHLMSASRDAQIKSWNAFDHYRLELSVSAHMYAINALSISPDHQLFVSGSMDKSIKLWDLNTFSLLKVIDKSRYAGHATSVNNVLWTNYKNHVLSCSDDKKISVWELNYK